MRLATARAAKANNHGLSAMVSKLRTEQSEERQKVFFVMGIMTARRIKKVGESKGNLMRFVIGHSATPGGVLDRAIDAEEEQHHDFLRLDHVEGYPMKLPSKTQIYFSTAVQQWDADFYVKVDDDVHVNPGVLGSTLARHRSKARVYMGCMKSGPVLAQKSVKYHEPEYWKFGVEGNKYFRHESRAVCAHTPQIMNEDVSLGSWFIGLNVEHIDDRTLCCGTPPDCELKAQAGNPCAASFDWSCSGICKSVERMEEVHQRCGEGDAAVWHTRF
ncbi:hypothetical protein IFM89_023976 [Coptis chinensis]|uniref:Hexosyltransferase n=1 Tax=Coptis chinensis TaxID=261450 RepID=A0A835LR88_9MAGN|nr:hypothetical protein IFM89_023976 [Coptis chinensis]